MAAEISSVRKMKHDGFMTLLSSAACEWFLMFLMFLDAALSYLLVKFAQYCELETPCLLCSRFDNGFGEKEPGFYWSSLCCNHREEISSLVACSIHGKFTDVHGMCEECLTPIAMKNKSNSESHRLLVGKSWVDVDRSFLQNMMLHKHIRFSSDVRTCSCCDQTWRPKSNTERLLEVNPGFGFGASKANVKPPLPRAPGSSRFSRRDSLKRLRDKFTAPTSHYPAEKSTVGGAMLSHVGYTKLKISSDSESEFPFSEDDDDGGTTDYSSKNYSRSEHNLQCNKRRLCKSQGNSDSEKRTHRGFQVKPPITLDQPYRPGSQPRNFIALSSDALVEHGVREKDQEKSYRTPSPSMTPQLVSSYDGLQPSDVADSFFSGSAETSECSYNLSHMPVISVLSELLSLCVVPPLSSNPTIPNQIDAGEDSQEGVTSGANHIEAASSDDVHSSETNDVHQFDASIQTDENSELSERNASEPINTCDSRANYIEAYAGTSSDDAHLPETNDMHQIEAPTQTDKNSELSDRNALEPISTCDSAAGTLSDDAHLLETNDTHQIDTNTNLELSDGKSSEPINTCDSGANHIEAAAGTSTNDAQILETNNYQNDVSTRTDEELELSERNASEPTNTSDSGVNHTEAAAGTTSDDAHFSETNDTHQINAASQTDEDLQISDRIDLEPINTSDSGVNHIEAAAETSSADANLSETKDMHQIDASTETDGNLELSDKNDLEPISTCDSGANHIEAAAGTSSNDDAHVSETNEMHPIEAPTQTDENLELSDRKTLEPSNTHDSDIYKEDKSQVSTSEVGSSNETSHLADHKNEEPKTDEGSSYQVLPVSASLKKSDSTHKFQELITLSFAEDDDIVNILKNQIEHDRNCLSSLYKDLEEERNAAAIAANEAMAMITRLQEEKAALHMEALQYLRMMEEQAEYDMEALERANDLLAEKDKELKDLEHELEFYRNNYLDRSEVQNAEETSSVDNRVAAHSETSPDASSNSKADKILRPNGNCKPITGTLSNFQDDKIYSQNV